MSRSFPWIWIALAGLLLLLPGPAGRFLLDLLGGITLTQILLPLLAGGAALIGWQVLRSRLHTCKVCGVSSLAQESCPACGSPYHAAGSVPQQSGVSTGTASGWLGREGEIDARTATINVEAVEVASSGEGRQVPTSSASSPSGSSPSP